MANFRATQCKSNSSPQDPLITDKQLEHTLSVGEQPPIKELKSQKLGDATEGTLQDTSEFVWPVKIGSHYHSCTRV